MADGARASGRPRGTPPPGEAGADELPQTRGRYQIGHSTTMRTIPSSITSTVGSGGTPCQVYSNYFKLTTPDTAPIYSYRVDFEPEVENVRVRRALLFGFAEKMNNSYNFDGGYELKTLTRL